MEWLTFVEGAAAGALTLVTSIIIAWRQRVFQLRDRAADRERDIERQQELEERESKILRRERWQPEYEDIRHCLDSGETLAYYVLDNGPCTQSELDALDIATFIMKSKILSERGIETLRNPLLGLASRATEMQRRAGSTETGPMTANARGQTAEAATSKGLLRDAIFQDRAANGLAEEIKATRRVLRLEWGD